jgi:hypothetical protein
MRIPPVALMQIKPLTAVELRQAHGAPLADA